MTRPTCEGWWEYISDDDTVSCPQNNVVYIENRPVSGIAPDVELFESDLGFIQWTGRYIERVSSYDGDDDE